MEGLAGLKHTPQLMSMAQNMMQNPAFMQMAQGMMGGMGEWLTLGVAAVVVWVLVAVAVDFSPALAAARVREGFALAAAGAVPVSRLVLVPRRAWRS